MTPALARFGPVSYQVSAISSVAVYHRPKLNPIAVTLMLAAVVLAAFAYFGREQYPDYSLWSAIAAPVALILGVAWQRLRPVLEYRFVMKTAGNETETVTTFDREQVLELREAIESAFQMPRVAGRAHRHHPHGAAGHRRIGAARRRTSTSRATGSSPIGNRRHAERGTAHACDVRSPGMLRCCAPH